MFLGRDFANSAMLKTIRRIKFLYALKQGIIFNAKLLAFSVVVIAGTFFSVIAIYQ